MDLHLRDQPMHGVEYPQLTTWSSSMFDINKHDMKYPQPFPWMRLHGSKCQPCSSLTTEEWRPYLCSCNPITSFYKFKSIPIAIQNRYILLVFRQDSRHWQGHRCGECQVLLTVMTNESSVVSDDCISLDGARRFRWMTQALSDQASASAGGVIHT